MKRWCTGMRLRALAVALAVSVTAACAWGQDDGVWRPEEVRGPTIGMEAEGTGGDSTEAETTAEISAWASLPADGPEGRPLPVAGSWMAEKMYGPAASVELIKQGHHMLITFLDPVHLARWEMAAEEGTPERVERKFEQYYRPALEYAAQHHLPIAMRGWNWADQVAGIQDRRDAVAGRQVLYAQGFHAAGLNVYLDGDTLYGGGWAAAEGMDATGWQPVWGRNWKGDWISHEGVQAGQWCHVALVIKDATDTVQADKMHLYVDGQRVGGAPAARIPRQYIVPRVGRAHINGKLLTLFHDGGKEAQPFRGRIDDFRLVNAAEMSALREYVGGGGKGRRPGDQEY